MRRLRGRIPSLDGLRALSIGLVILSHLNGTGGFITSEEIGRWHLGTLGVRVFFVISGFLITTLLLEEVDRTGAISLRGFYMRRFFRIFPAFYALCLVLFALNAARLITLHHGDVLAAATYTMNYHHDRSWYVGHLWSLAVEEQFYLLWPALLVFVGIGRGHRMALAVLLIAPLLRIGLGVFPAFRAGIGESFPTVADALATGCLLATAGPALARAPRWRSFLAGRAWWLAPLAVAVFARVPFTKVGWLVGETVMNVGIAVIIARTIEQPGDRLGKLLNSRPLVWVGTLSYSIYLWQQMFLNRHGSSIAQAFPLNLTLALLAACASYYLIERPFLLARHTLEKRPGRRPPLHLPPPQPTPPAPAGIRPAG
ncbi:MAG TPA: acyltransferase [Polyangia bacterium]